MDFKNIMLVMLLLSNTAYSNPPCTGDELRFTFRNIELKVAFAILADFSGHKIVIDPSITWSGPLNFDCTAWDNVAYDLANQHQLILEIKHGTMYVSKK